MKLDQIDTVFLRGRDNNFAKHITHLISCIMIYFEYYGFLWIDYFKKDIRLWLSIDAKYYQKSYDFIRIETRI